MNPQLHEIQHRVRCLGLNRQLTCLFYQPEQFLRLGGSGYFSTTVILWVPNLSVLPEAAEFAVLMQLFDPHDL